MHSRSRWAGGLVALLAVCWLVKDAADTAQDAAPQVRQPAPKPHRRPLARPPTTPNEANDPAQVEITVHLTRSSHLRQQTDFPAPFAPNAFIPLPEEGLLPDTPASEALQDVLSAEADEYSEAVDEFLDEALDEDAPSLDTDNPWAILIELEAERLAVDEDFARDQEREMAALQRVRSSGDADDLKAWRDLPAPAKHNEDLLDLAQSAAEEHGDSAVGSIAQLYMAQAYSDWDSSVFSEARSQRVLLDTLYATDDPTIIEGAIEMLTPLSAGSLHEDDLAVLEDSFEVIDPELRAPLARFLLDQNYAAGDPDSATAWADQLEAELLSGHDWGSDTGNRWWELDEARDRLAADMDTPVTGWKDGFDRVCRQCWSESRDRPDMHHAQSTSLHWTWDDAWQMEESDAPSALVDCISSRGDLIPEPTAPVEVTVHIALEGAAP